MAHPENRLSSEVVPAPWVDPNGRDFELNEDLEGGPIAPQDTSEGLNYQAWKLTFAGGTFTITPELSGSPVDVLTGQDSEQCSLAFDQNARPHIAWITSAGALNLYWYDTVVADFVITEFAPAAGGVGLTLDDKRKRQTGASDILLYYTVQNGSDFLLIQRRQRDRFDDVYEQDTSPFDLIQKIGMNQGSRVQIQRASVA